jgi:hypothetical protein
MKVPGGYQVLVVDGRGHLVLGTGQLFSRCGRLLDGRRGTLSATWPARVAACLGCWRAQRRAAA